jgi:molybdenum cofactor cytidylyltransferase
MRFGPVPVGDALGAILAHSTRLDDGVLKKGRVLGADDVARLARAGHETVVAARLEGEDVPEDQAAERLARVLAGDGVEVGAAFTGRVNLYAAAPGLLVVNREGIDAVNAVDEALTIATLASEQAVSARQMIATAKVIPFAARRAALERVEAAAPRPPVEVRAFTALRVGLVQTRLAGTRVRVLDKTRAVLDARLEALGGHLVEEARCSHDAARIAEPVSRMVAGGLDVVLVAGASAIVDRRDAVPAAIELAGGEIHHFGMPVDPGNLLLLGAVGRTPVVGMPGCARSSKFNGFDQVLQRLAARLPLDSGVIMAMGVGGLLKEIPERGQPRGRERAGRVPARLARVAALVLAAGQSRRMGTTNKMLVELPEGPMVRVVVRAAASARVTPVVVVTGHEHDQVAAALAGEAVALVRNPDYAEGISTSLRAGLAALPREVEAVIVCLGDMPEVQGRHLEKLIAAFDPLEGREICVPVHRGKRGNPVLFGRRFFDAMGEVRGDVGARHLIGEFSEWVCEVPVDDQAVLVDLDTQEALTAWSAQRR